MAPNIHFCRGGSGHNIAYALDGQGPALVCPAWWVSHLERDWKLSPFRDFFGALAQAGQVLRYDRPGVGLSDRERENFDLEREVSDLEALVDHLALERFALLGISCGGPVAIAYACRHPQRVSHLMLFGAFADGATLAPAEVQAALTALVRAHWGLGSRALADLLAPDLTGDELRQFGADQRAAASAEMAARLMELTFRMDVRPLLAGVSVPTLVLHRKQDHTVQFHAGRDLAASIPGATFKPLTGRAHVPWHDDTRELLTAILQFIDHAGAPPVESGAVSPPVWLREGDLWRLSFAGRSVHLKHSKGLMDLSLLLSAPGREIPAVDLYAGPGPKPAMPDVEQPLLDDRAREAFRRRLVELGDELAEAESWSDLGRLSNLNEERQALLDSLRDASGIGGRPRQFSGPSERARKAVSGRIRETIRRISSMHPDLAGHLDQSVRTGAFCSYDPTDALRWKT